MLYLEVLTLLCVLAVVAGILGLTLPDGKD